MSNLPELERLPLILTLTEMAALYRVAVPTIRRNLQNGTFRPQPWEHYPYRWRREDVIADFKRLRAAHVPSNHGGKVKRAKPAKATLPRRSTPARARAR